jgi:hypothetical protein
MDQVMEEVKELRFPHDTATFKPEEEQLWATLRFRLGTYLRANGLGTLHRPHDNKFLKNF